MPDLISLMLTLMNVGLAAVLEYISLHVLFCLVPAFFLAGAYPRSSQKSRCLNFWGPMQTRRSHMELLQ